MSPSIWESEKKKTERGHLTLSSKEGGIRLVRERAEEASDPKLLSDGKCNPNPI